ncbi:hypothetical protein AAG570_007567 [Ranatra chinensis]|uniref:Uncharacterized protein n=1 Tax=Ranatra chinensis TaxID=642074 RepID=A0ABD0XWL0_9HEMI
MASRADGAIDSRESRGRNWVFGGEELLVPIAIPKRLSGSSRHRAPVVETLGDIGSQGHYGCPRLTNETALRRLRVYRTRGTVECTKCQEYRHTKGYCHLLPLCVRCGSGPESSTCLKTRVYKDLQKISGPAHRGGRAPGGSPDLSVHDAGCRWSTPCAVADWESGLATTVQGVLVFVVSNRD